MDQLNTEQAYTVPAPQTTGEKANPKKYAFFAPVAIIVSFILSQIFNAIGNYIYAEHLANGESALLLNLFSSITYGLSLIISIGIAYLILSNCRTFTYKRILPMSLIPLAVIQVINTVSSVIGNALLLMSISISANAIVMLCTKIFLILLGAVLSYFLCAKLLEADAPYEIACKEADKSTVQNQSEFPPYQPITDDTPNTSNPTANGAAGFPSVQKSAKSKTVAGLFCFFLGELGIHRFYVGKIGTGILYLLTGGLFFIGSLIDFIMIIFGGFKDSDGKPLS